MKQTDRIEEVDILRGLAAVLMILGHSFIVYPIDISGVSWCKAVQHFIYTFHMELFFVLAGVVYRCKNYGTFMAGKVKRILIPYIFFGTFTIIAKAYGGLLVNGTVSLSQGIFKLLFRGGGYWFLYVSFLLFAVYPLIEKICDKLWKKILLAVVMLIVDMVIELPSIFAINNLVYYMPYFVFGNCIRENIPREGKTKREGRQLYIGLCALIVYVLIDAVEVIGIYEMNGIFRFIRAIAIIVFLFICIYRVNGLWKRNYLTKWIHGILVDSSKFSLQLYLFNGYLLTFFRTLICSFLHINSPILIVLGIWVGDIMVTLIACKWIIPKIPIVGFCCGIRDQHTH